MLLLSISGYCNSYSSTVFVIVIHPQILDLYLLLLLLLYSFIYILLLLLLFMHCNFAVVIAFYLLFLSLFIYCYGCQGCLQSAPKFTLLNSLFAVATCIPLHP